MDVRSKGCAASAKQRWGTIAKTAPKTQRVHIKRKGFSVRCGQNAKDASRKLCKPCVGVLFKLLMNLSIARKNGSNEPKWVMV